MRSKEGRLTLGVALEKAVLAKKRTREDISLVLTEAPDIVDNMATMLIERADIIRGDKDCFRLTDEEVVIQMPALKRPTLAEVQAGDGRFAVSSPDVSVGAGK